MRDSARVVARFWRAKRSRSTHLLGKAAVQLANLEGLTFENALSLLRKDSVAANTKKFIQRIEYLVHRRHVDFSMQAVRKFLSAFLIATFPGRVLGKDEQLSKVAEKLVAAYESIRRGVASRPFHALTKSFPTLLLEYLKTWQDWSTKDKARLATLCKNLLVSLHRSQSPLIQHEKNMEIAKLKSKLKMLAGPEGLRAFEAELPKLMHQRGFNEQLVHELILNPAFEITESSATENDWPGRKGFEDLFWDRMADDLLQQRYLYFLITLADLSRGIAELYPKPTKGVIDIDLVEQQIAANAWSWDCCADLIRSLDDAMQQLEAQPAMQPREAAMQPTDARSFCAALQGLHRRLDAVRIRLSNKHLRKIAPALLENGVAYEQSKLREKTATGGIALTKAWIRASLAALKPDFPHIVAAIAQRQGAAMVRAHASAIVDLAVGAGDVPETLALDARHLAALRRKFDQVVAWCVILVTLRQCSHSTAGATTLLLRDAQSSDWRENAVALGASPDYLKIVNGRLSNAADPVHALMRRRVQAAWEHAVGGVRSAPMPGEEALLANEGTDLLQRIALLNRKVAAPIYSRIMPEIAGE